MREQHKRAMQGRTQSLSKSGRSLASITRPETPPDIPIGQIPSVSSESIGSRLPPDVLQAVISSQRMTIDNYQKDRDRDHAKISQLKIENEELAKLVKSRSDYDNLKAQSLFTFEAGVDLGMSKVTRMRHLRKFNFF